MEWYIWSIIFILVIIIFLFLRRIFNKSGNEDIFESAGNRMKKIGSCCAKLFGGK
jgi:hypothetical protein